mmetsp:Transcript_42406/g.66118  ORF Transcript_42406/g.66118 Transcript_42406/m.66118 type:complete len:86 (-) Transcript_42406:18-275(-)
MSGDLIVDPLGMRPLLDIIVFALANYLACVLIDTTRLSRNSWWNRSDICEDYDEDDLGDVRLHSLKVTGELVYDVGLLCVEEGTF